MEALANHVSVAENSRLHEHDLFSTDAHHDDDLVRELDDHNDSYGDDEDDDEMIFRIQSKMEQARMTRGMELIESPPTRLDGSPQYEVFSRQQQQEHASERFRRNHELHVHVEADDVDDQSPPSQSDRVEAFAQDNKEPDAVTTLSFPTPSVRSDTEPLQPRLGSTFGLLQALNYFDIERSRPIGLGENSRVESEPLIGEISELPRLDSSADVDGDPGNAWGHSPAAFGHGLWQALPGMTVSMSGLQITGAAMLCRSYDDRHDKGFRTGFLLCDDTGTGKTLVVLSLLSNEIRRGRVPHPSLVIVTSTDAWMAEITKHCPVLLDFCTVLGNDTCENLDVDQLKTPILIVQCDNPAVTTFLTGLDNHAFERMIIDDCHTLNRQPALFEHIVRRVLAGPTYVVGITSTPISMHGAGDLFPILKLIGAFSIEQKMVDFVEFIDRMPGDTLPRRVERYLEALRRAPCGRPFLSRGR